MIVPEFTEVADRVCIASYEWADVNITAIGSARGLVVVDTHGATPRIRCNTFARTAFQPALAGFPSDESAHRGCMSNLRVVSPAAEIAVPISPISLRRAARS